MKDLFPILCSKLFNRLEGHDAEVNLRVWMWKPMLLKVVQIDIHETPRWLWFSASVSLMQLELSLHRAFHDMLICYDEWDCLFTIQLVFVKEARSRTDCSRSESCFNPDRGEKNLF